jgi:hypothetical protein
MQSGTTVMRAKIGSLTLTADATALVGSLILWLVLTVAGMLWLDYSLPKAILMGFAATILHWVCDLLHQAGHAIAARSTGYPVSGVRLWGLLSSTTYPSDEPALPRSVHFRRAIGGPLLSLALSIIAAAALLVLHSGSWICWLDLFFLLDNFLVFTVGALLPLGFTDGSTLLRLMKSTDQT